MKRANIRLSPVKNSPTSNMMEVAPQYICDFKKCELNLSIGLFFDGTNNNLEHDLKTFAHTNIARLYDAYGDDKVLGFYRNYIPGVGTKFPEIGEQEDSNLGSGCAFGCEARVIFALLAVLNSIHHRCFKENMIDIESVLALCRNSLNVTDSKDRNNLAKLGIYNGLLQPKLGSNNNRRQFLSGQSSNLELKFKNKKPHIVECFIDVFGFSRGAAEARVFCYWLNELLVNGRLAGVPLQFRFVGIIDTVASAGFWSGGSASAMNSTGGHGAWASADAMQIPTSVKNCFHMVAMHEFRRNFPLDEIGIDGKLQPGWIQHVYPGAHSDVGGGYRPGEFGISAGSDSSKLSQIPLNHMLDCAIAAGVPIKKPKISHGGYDPFAIHPDLLEAYENFISQSTLTPRPIYEWLQPYLNWRWQIRDHFHACNQVKQATQAEKDILLSFNKSLINDAAAMTRSASMNVGQRTLAVFKGSLLSDAKKDFITTTLLEAEAREVFALAQRAKPTPLPFAVLFDRYVHDSLAGFNHPSLELTGYWRYRRVFLGSNDHTIASNQEIDTARSTA